jgi:hypothetical protein
MSIASTEQGESLTCAEEAARVTEKIIITLAAQYKNIRERSRASKKREKEAT